MEESRCNFFLATTESLSPNLAFSIGCSSRPLQPDKALAPILTAVESCERIGAGFKAVKDVLLVAQLAGPHPVRKGRDRGLPAVHVVQNHETLRAGALDQEVAFDARSCRPGVPGRDRGCAADDHAGADREAWIDRIADDAGGVVEIDVDALATGLVDRLAEARRLVIDRRVVAEDVETLAELVWPSGDPDRPTAE